MRSIAGGLGAGIRDAEKKTKDLKEISPSFAATVKALSKEPPDRANRVAAFVRDLNAALIPF